MTPEADRLRSTRAASIVVLAALVVEVVNELQRTQVQQLQEVEGEAREEGEGERLWEFHVIQDHEVEVIASHAAQSLLCCWSLVVAIAARRRRQRTSRTGMDAGNGGERKSGENNESDASITRRARERETVSARNKQTSIAERRLDQRRMTAGDVACECGTLPTFSVYQRSRVTSARCGTRALTPTDSSGLPHHPSKPMTRKQRRWDGTRRSRHQQQQAALALASVLQQRSPWKPAPTAKTHAWAESGQKEKGEAVERETIQRLCLRRRRCLS